MASWRTAPSRKGPRERGKTQTRQATAEAVLFVLTRLFPVLRPGDRIYFDEFYDPLNEFAAFNDFVRSYYVKEQFVLIGRSYDACAFEFETA